MAGFARFYLLHMWFFWSAWSSFRWFELISTNFWWFQVVPCLAKCDSRKIFEKFLKNWLNIFRVNSFKVIVSTNKLLKQLFQYSQPNVEQNQKTFFAYFMQKNRVILNFKETLSLPDMFFFPFYNESWTTICLNVCKKFCYADWQRLNPGAQGENLISQLPWKAAWLFVKRVCPVHLVDRLG